MAFEISNYTQLLCQVSAKSVDPNLWPLEHFLRQWHLSAWQVDKKNVLQFRNIKFILKQPCQPSSNTLFFHPCILIKLCCFQNPFSEDQYIPAILEDLEVKCAWYLHSTIFRCSDRPTQGSHRRNLIWLELYTVPVSTQIYGLSAPIPEEIVLAISLTCLDHEKYWKHYSQEDHYRDWSNNVK